MTPLCLFISRIPTCILISGIIVLATTASSINSRKKSDRLIRARVLPERRLLPFDAPNAPDAGARDWISADAENEKAAVARAKAAISGLSRTSLDNRFESLAERRGFEPRIGLTLYTLSRRATSTAHPSLLHAADTFANRLLVCEAADYSKNPALGKRHLLWKHFSTAVAAPAAAAPTAHPSTAPGSPDSPAWKYPG
jgi:hypothetical protein